MRSGVAVLVLYPWHPTLSQLSESLSVFDVDGEGFVPLSHIRHLLTDSASGEGLAAEQCDLLLDTLEVNEDGMVRIADIVQLIQQK